MLKLTKSHSLSDKNTVIKFFKVVTMAVSRLIGINTRIKQLKSSKNPQT